VDGVWALWRDTGDCSPLDYAQCSVRTFSNDGKTIDGRYQIRDLECRAGLIKPFR
jgi:hypothetical protein